MKILVVGDPHARPEYDNDRFEWLGKHIAATRPDAIVVLGDWCDFESLCTHATKKKKEGARVLADIRSLHDSLRRLERPIQELNQRLKDAHKARYRPRKIYLIGNHEKRVDQIAEEQPELEGVFEGWLEPFEDRGWEVVPFLETFQLAGYDFSHYYTLGTSGRATGGASGTKLAQALLRRNVSTVVGHDHRFGIASEPKGNTGRVWGINAGCYVHPDYTDGWCRQTRPMWDLGVLTLDGAQNGEHLRHSWVSQEALKRRYGS